MNLMLVILLVFILYLRTKETMFTRANSYDISNYASNTYPCVNESTPVPHFQT